VYYQYFRTQFKKPEEEFSGPPKAKLKLFDYPVIRGCVNADEFDWQADHLIKEIQGCKKRIRRSFVAWETKEQERRREWQLSREQADSDDHDAPHDEARAPL